MLLNSFQLFIFVLVLSSGVYSNKVTIFNQCINLPSPVGELCVNATTSGCLEIQGSVSHNGRLLYGPPSILISELLQVLQSKLDEGGDGHPLICHDLDLSLSPTQCSICAEFQQVQVIGDVLHVCGNSSVNCSAIFGKIPTVHLSEECFSISQCSFLACQNNCSNLGTCSSLGVCKCNTGYFGPDCSIRLTDSCVESSYLPSTCWSASFPNCHSINYEVESEKTKYKFSSDNLSEIKSLVLVPCESLSVNENCEFCVNATKVRVEGDSIVGCPIINFTCSGDPIYSYPLPCTKLITNSALLCPNTDATTITSAISDDDDDDDAVISNASLTALGVILGISIIGIIVFVILRRFGIIIGSGPIFTPVNDDDDDHEIDEAAVIKELEESQKNEDSDEYL